MSKSGVEQVIGRLLTDTAFRNAVVADPVAALSGYDLTDAERSAFVRLDPDQLEGAAADLDQRLSRVAPGVGASRKC